MCTIVALLDVQALRRPALAARMLAYISFDVFDLPKGGESSVRWFTRPTCSVEDPLRLGEVTDKESVEGYQLQVSSLLSRKYCLISHWQTRLKSDYHNAEYSNGARFDCAGN